jgi:hypothetical protein
MNGELAYAPGIGRAAMCCLRVGPMALALMLGVPNVAAACSCPAEPLGELVARLGVVFDGTVEGGPSRVTLDAIGSVGQRDVYRFKVRRVWKGDVGPSFVVAFPPLQGGNCGLALKDGDTMLVGAYAQRGRLAEGNSCTYMNMNEPKRDYVRELGPPRIQHP